MTNWPRKKLGEVCEIISPGIKKFEGSKQYIATADVDFDKIVNFTEITYKNRPSRANIEVKENDVLVARMAETKKFLMADKNFQDNYIFSTGFAVLRAKDELIPKYLFYFLTTKDFNLQKDKLAVGATQKAINNPALKKIKIPLPPLKIQQKIVERLDAIKNAQELNDKQIELAEELFQSLLHRELDPKGKNWEVKKLGGVAFVDWGNTSITKASYKPSGYLAISATGPDGFLETFEHNRPAIVLSAIGAQCGKTFWVEGKWTAIKNTIIIFSNDEKIVLTKYLFYYLTPDKWKKVGAGQSFITKSGAERIKISLPPLETQQKIVEKLSAVQEYKKRLVEQREKLKELFESVLHKSMAGKFD
jgi:restriction endonuclease S subunit